MNFKKATIEEISDKPSQTPQAVHPPVEVQINPATIRLQMASTVDFGKDAGRQKTQYQGSTSTLSFELVYDTADEGTTDSPVDVRTRTRSLEKYVLPAQGKAKAVPPRLRFTYGTFIVVGVMTALNQDFDLFATNGVPLRAKCAVTIKEQKPEFEAGREGPGANTGSGATPPVPPSGGTPGAGGAPSAPGLPSGPPADRTGTAVAGESAAGFASRMGLDPRAWKGLEGITDPLRLDAGLQIDFSASLSLDAGLGVEVSPTAGTRAGAASGPTGAGPVPPTAPADGTALTAAGGLTRALDHAAAAAAGTAAAGTRAAFTAGPAAAGPPAPAESLGGAPPASGARPAVVAGSPHALMARPAGSRPQPGANPAGPADPRALSYGYGVPLRGRRGTAQATVSGVVHERHGATAVTGDRPPETDDPTVAGWHALATLATVPTGSARATAGGSCGCGCGGSRGGKR
jgi:hypothetical protein